MSSKQQHSNQKKFNLNKSHSKSKRKNYNHLRITKKKQCTKNNLKSNDNSSPKEIEQKCIKLFGSKKKCNKFIKQALIKGNQIRTKTKHLRYDYKGYQILIKDNDLKTNKKLAMKALVNIQYDGNKSAQRLSSTTSSSSSSSKTLATSSNNKHIQNNKGYPSLYQPEYQYSAKDEILILGEMDFSYALDIMHKIGGKNIIATAYYQQHFMKDKTMENIKLIQKFGKQPLFGIDATNLESKLPETMIRMFDKILFAFPRNSLSPDSQKHNIVFMKKVFESVRKYLKDDGQFQVLLHVNKSGHSPLEQWKMKYNNWSCVHEHIYSQKQMKKMFALYQSRDGKNSKWMPYRSGLYVFKKKF